MMDNLKVLKTIKVKLEDIRTDRNMRITEPITNDDDVNKGRMGVSDIMNSFKEVGQETPIGLDRNLNLLWGNRRWRAAHLLGWSDILATIFDIETTEQDRVIYNAVENLNRANLTPIDLGYIVTTLKSGSYKMSESEIASKLSIAVKRIRDAEYIFTKCPKSYRNRIRPWTANGQRKRSGLIPPDLMEKAIRIITSIPLSETDGDKLLDRVKQDDFKVGSLRIIATLIKRGIPIDDAIRTERKYVFGTMGGILLQRTEIEYRLREDKCKTINELLKKIIFGKAKPLKECKI